MLTPPAQALLADIMGRFPPALLQAFPMMILRWPGCEPPERFRQIHSDGDWLIRPDGQSRHPHPRAGQEPPDHRVASRGRARTGCCEAVRRLC